MSTCVGQVGEFSQHVAGGDVCARCGVWLQDEDSEDAGLVLSAEEAFAFRVADVVALGAELDQDDLRDTETVAVAVLNTDWLAARVEAARAKERERIAAALEADAAGLGGDAIQVSRAARIARTPARAAGDDEGGGA